jgi:Tfp pilus assembly protein PilF
VARQGTDVDAKVATEIVRAEARLEKGDRAGARALLVQITTAAPTVARPHLRLALLEDSNGEHDAAIAGYRRVLQLQPHNVLALNNLAYDLAVYKSAPMEARVFAIRAVNESKREGPIVDTLAWVEHLLGNETSAGALIAEAVRSTPNNATIRLHAAFISAARGDVNAAATQLKEAVRRNPALEHEADVQELQQRLHNGTRND